MQRHDYSRDVKRLIPSHWRSRLIATSQQRSLRILPAPAVRRTRHARAADA
jgi:hypothetical protein